MLAGMIFQIEPFFKGESNRYQLVKIAEVLGTTDLQRYLMKYGIKLDENFMSILGTHEKIEWSEFINSENEELCSKEAFEFLSQLLVYDHSRRIIPSEAMELKYFESVRKYHQENTMKA